MWKNIFGLRMLKRELLQLITVETKMAGTKTAGGKRRVLTKFMISLLLVHL